VVEVLPHPGGDLIWLAKVDIGTDRHPQIVWGGVPVVTEGSLVPVALPGTWLPPTKGKPNPYKIRRRRYRGEISEGMLCSCAELGWDSSATDRVALLDASAGLRVGESLDDRYVDWPSIVRTADDLLGAEDSASSNRPKMPEGRQKFSQGTGSTVVEKFMSLPGPKENALTDSVSASTA
jgi:tRNA-binding EMAP/Myf-like protein